MRMVLCLMLALVSAPASAEWVKARENAQFVTYIDWDIVKEGNVRRVWYLQDVKKRVSAEIGGFLSAKSRWEFDCGLKKARVVELATFSGPMAKGKRLSQDNEADEWAAIPPDSDIELMSMLACDK